MAGSRLPRWAAPITGLGVGAWVGLQAGAKGPEKEDANRVLLAVVLGAVSGLAAGAFVWLMEGFSPSGTSHRGVHSGFARATAVASAIFFLAPIAGVLISLLAVIANRRTAGWPNAASWIGLLASTIVTILFAYAVWVP